jgi:citrate lyase subunit beta/citryl-CoA lyase
MPGSSARAFEKARQLPADSLIFDLEDSVAADQKEAARQQVLEVIAEGDYGNKELIVRVNGLHTGWGEEDLKVFSQSAAHAVLLPKIDTVGQLQESMAVLEQSGASSKVAVWLMAETPLCVLNIKELAAGHPRLQAIVMGTSDLAKDLRVPQTPGRLGLLPSLGMCVLAARANGLAVIDGVSIDLQDEAGFVNACQQGKELGFDGKTLIHPKQLAAANDIFGPSDEELESARQIIAAWDEAQRAGKGVTTVNGRLVEELHVVEAKRLTAIAEAIASF